MTQMINHITKATDRTRKMHELLLGNDSFAVIDIETSGLSPDKGGRIIEIGGVKIKNGKIVDQFEELIYPEGKIYRQTIELTGITNEMLVGKRTFGQVLPEFYEWMEGLPVIAHNSTFDWTRFLVPFFKRVGIIAENEIICSRALSKFYLPEMKTHKLNEVCDKFGINIEGHHRALDDSVALAKIVFKFKQDYANRIGGSNIEKTDLFSNTDEFKPTAPIPTDMPDFRIRRVSYWEKKISKAVTYQRIYVTTTIGSIFYDIPTKTWYNKDIAGSLNFNEIQERVLKFARCNSLYELDQFRGSC